MRKLLPSQRLAPAIRRFSFRSRRGAWPALLAGMLLSLATNVQAQTPNSPDSAAPAELTGAIAAMDDAASRQDVGQVMALIDEDFMHADGLTRDMLQQALEGFWERYDELTYTTTLDSWQQSEDGVVAETTTEIAGLQRTDVRDFQLLATVTSRQTYRNGLLVQQETLTEDNRLSSGTNPPDLQVQAPDSVPTTRNFAFDVIVPEPLGDRQLLGTAIEESITPDTYLSTPRPRLELLNAGGLFKTGRAPALSGSRWVSGIIIREDGMTTVTRRIRFTQ